MASATVSRSSAISSAFAAAHDEIDNGLISSIVAPSPRLDTEKIFGGLKQTTATHPAWSSRRPTRTFKVVVKPRSHAATFTTTLGFRAVVADGLTMAQAKMLDKSDRLHVDRAGRCSLPSRGDLLYVHRKHLFDIDADGAQRRPIGSLANGGECGDFTDLHSAYRAGPQPVWPDLHESILLGARQTSGTPASRLRSYRTSFNDYIAHEPELARHGQVVLPGALKLSCTDEEFHDHSSTHHKALIHRERRHLLAGEIATGVHDFESCKLCLQGCSEIGAARYR